MLTVRFMDNLHALYFLSPVCFTFFFLITKVLLRENRASFWNILFTISRQEPVIYFREN